MLFFSVVDVAWSESVWLEAYLDSLLCESALRSAQQPLKSLCYLGLCVKSFIFFRFSDI